MLERVTTLQGAHGWFVCAEDGGGPQGGSIDGRHEGLAVCNRATAGEWEQIRVIRQTDGRWALQSSDGYYLCAESMKDPFDGAWCVIGYAAFNRGTVGEWECWTAEPMPDGRVALRSWDGVSYLVAEPTGDLSVRRPGTDDGSPGPWESFTAPSPWWEIKPHVDQVAHPHPFAGQFTTLGESCFADDRGPRIDNASYHGGDLFGLYCASFERDKSGLRSIVMDTLASCRAVGYPHVRSWVSVNDARDPSNIWAVKGAPLYVGWGLRATPDFQVRVVEFAQLLRSFGLAWHCAPGGLDQMDALQEARLFVTLRDAVSQAGPSCFSLIEACNEAGGTTDDRSGVAPADSSPENLERLINIIRLAHPNVLYALTAFAGSDDPAVLARFNRPGVTRFAYTHQYRGGKIADKIRHRGTFARDNGIHRLVGDGESCGPFSDHGIPGNGLTCVSAQEYGKREDRQFDDESVAAIGAATAIQHGWPSFMCSAGVRSYTSPTEFPGFASLPRLLRLLPAYTHLGKLTHGGRSDAVIKAVVNPEGYLGRADQCLVTNPQTGAREIVAILYGENPSNHESDYAFPSTAKIEGVIIHPGTGERHPIAWSGPGSVRTVRMQWARIIVGTIS